MGGRSRIFAGVIILIAVWQAICSLGLVSPVILASPVAVVQAGLASPLEFLSALQITAIEILISVAISWSVGIAVGLVAGSNARCGDVLGPFMAAIFAVPHIIWFPLVLIWFGIG